MPYLANIDGIIWLVIIVVSIIAQIVKAGKKAAEKAAANAPQTESPRSATAERRETRSAAQRTTAPRPKTARDRTDELRQFFESLGVPTQELAPAPPPPPRPRAKPAKASPSPQPVATRKAQPHRDTESVELENLDRGESAYTREFRQLLQQENTQRQAVVLREILGPPLALR